MFAPTWLHMSRRDTKWTIWPHVAPCGSICTHLYLHIYISISISISTSISIYIYIIHTTHIIILFQRVVSHRHNPALQKSEMRPNQHWKKKTIGNISWSSQYTLCTVPPPIVPLREQAGRPEMRRCVLPIGLPNQTERAHNIGDNSVLLMGVQSYRYGTQNWRSLLPSSAFPIILNGHTKLAIDPPFMRVPNHTERVHKIGDSSDLHGRSQSYRRGTQNRR